MVTLADAGIPARVSPDGRAVRADLMPRSRRRTGRSSSGGRASSTRSSARRRSFRRARWAFATAPTTRRRRWASSRWRSLAATTARHPRPAAGVAVVPAHRPGSRDQGFEIAAWIKVTCALVMAAGTAAGGWRIIKTLGHKMVKLHPINGFAAETSSAAVIIRRPRIRHSGVDHAQRLGRDHGRRRRQAPRTRSSGPSSSAWSGRGS